MISLGVSPQTVTDTSGFHAGTRGRTDDFREFMYQRAGNAISRNDAVEITGETAFTLDGVRVSGEAGNIVAVAFRDVAEGEYGWFQVYGAADLNTVQAAVDKGAELWPGPQANTGQLSNEALGRPVDGLYVTGAGEGNVAPVMLSYPRIAAQASTGTGASNVPDQPAPPAETTVYGLQVTPGGQGTWRPTGDSAVPDPSDAAPQQPDGNQGEAGDSDEYSRADHKHPLPNNADGSNDGLMSTEDKQKLDGIPENADHSPAGIPDAPGTGVADADYSLRVPADGGPNTWQVSQGGGGSVDLTDDAVLDLAKSSRGAGDRGSVLGVSLTDEDDLTLLRISSPESLEGRIGNNEALLADMTRETPVRTGYADVDSDGTEGQIAVRVTNSGDLDAFINAARLAGLTWAQPSVVAQDGVNTFSNLAVRIPVNSDPRQYRATNKGSGFANQIRYINTWAKIQSDDDWDYYSSAPDSHHEESFTGRWYLQYKPTAHVGTTKFDGDLGKTSVYQQIKAIFSGDVTFDDDSEDAMVSGAAAPTSGLNQSQVDARIAAWARTGQTNPLTTLRDSVAAAGDTLAKLYALVTARLPLAGGTMTGLLTLSGAPTDDLHAATKAYVDANAGSGGGGGGAAGPVRWTAVGGAVNVGSVGTTNGPALADLEDIIALEISFNRGGTRQMVHLLRKAAIGSGTGNSQSIILQGSGTDSISLYHDGTNLVWSQSAAFGSITAGSVSIRHYNVVGGGSGSGGGGDAIDYDQVIRVLDALPSDVSGYSDGNLIEVGGQQYELAPSSAFDFAGVPGQQTVTSQSGPRTIRGFVIPFDGSFGINRLGTSTYNPDAQIVSLLWNPNGEFTFGITREAYNAISNTNKAAQLTNGVRLNFTRTDGTNGSETINLAALDQTEIDALLDADDDVVWPATIADRPAFTTWGSFSLVVLVGSGAAARLLTTASKVWNAIHDPKLDEVADQVGQNTRGLRSAIHVRPSLPTPDDSTQIGEVIYVDGNLYEATESGDQGIVFVPGRQRDTIVGIDNDRYGYVSPVVASDDPYSLHQMGELTHNPVVNDHPEVLAISCRRAAPSSGTGTNEASIYVLVSVEAYAAAKGSAIADLDPLTMTVSHASEQDRTTNSLRRVANSDIEFLGHDYTVFRVVEDGATYAAIQSAHADITNFIDSMEEAQQDGNEVTVVLYAANAATAARKLEGLELGWTQRFDDRETDNLQRIQQLERDGQAVQGVTHKVQALDEVTTDLSYGDARAVSWAQATAGTLPNSGVALRNHNWERFQEGVGVTLGYRVVAGSSAAIVNLNGESYILFITPDTTDLRLVRANVLDEEGNHAFYIYGNQFANLGNIAAAGAVPRLRVMTVWRGQGTDGHGPIPERYTVVLEVPNVTTHVGQTEYRGKFAGTFDSVELDSAFSAATLPAGTDASIILLTAAQYTGLNDATKNNGKLYFETD